MTTVISDSWTFVFQGCTKGQCFISVWSARLEKIHYN